LAGAVLPTTIPDAAWSRFEAAHRERSGPWVLGRPEPTGPLLLSSMVPRE